MADEAKRVLYITATGPADPTRASIPFHLAVNGSAEIGDQVDLVLAGDAADLARADVIAGVRGLAVPPLSELVAKATAGGVAFHV